MKIPFKTLVGMIPFFISTLQFVIASFNSLDDVEAVEEGAQHCNNEICKKLSPTGVANEDELLCLQDPSTTFQEVSEVSFDIWDPGSWKRVFPIPKGVT